MSFFLVISIISITYSCKKAVAPTVSTGSATNVQYQTATTAGSVDNNGGGTVSERGFVYSNVQSVTIGGTYVKQAISGSGDGAFTSDLTGLSPSTTYYYKAYAINEAGTSYGEEKTFTTL